MREAMGSSWLLYIAFTIIFLFVFFIAFVMNYASAYRAGNFIVTQIEACEGRMNECASSSFSTLSTEVKEKYHYTSEIEYRCENVGNRGVVYKVTLKVAFELPFLGQIGIYNVHTETKTIYDGMCDALNYITKTN